MHFQSSKTIQRGKFIYLRKCKHVKYKEIKLQQKVLFIIQNTFNYSQTPSFTMLHKNNFKCEPPFIGEFWLCATHADNEANAETKA